MKPGGEQQAATISAGVWAGHIRILCACVVGLAVWLGTNNGALLEYSIEAPSDPPRSTFLKGSSLSDPCHF